MDDCEGKIPYGYASPNLRKAEGCGAFAPIQDEPRRHRLTKSGGMDKKRSATLLVQPCMQKPWKDVD